MFAVQEEQAMSQVPQYPIECNRLAQYVQERKKKRMLFKGEYLVRDMMYILQDVLYAVRM